MTHQPTQRVITTWIARGAVALTCVVNLWCIINFLLFPDYYAAAYELSGVPGRVATQGIAVAFLMWNATYPLVIINPVKYRVLYAVVLAQQAIGLLGETFIYLQIGAGHELLSANILRFIVFDGAGLVLMGAAYIALMMSLRKETKEACSTIPEPRP